MINTRKINKFIQVGILDLKAFALRRDLSNKREIEKRGTNYLLQHLLKLEEVPLAYSQENKPYLSGREEHISISHSHDKLAIILNSTEHTGIDIELIRDKVLNIQQKFLNPQELLFANNDVEKLVTMWAAKETMFKIYGLKEVEFIANIFLENYSENEIKAKLKTKTLDKDFLLIHETIDNYKLVYAIHELQKNN